MGESYKNFQGNTAQAAMFQTYVTVDNIQGLIDDMEGVTFALESERARGRALIAKVTKVRGYLIYGEKKRFPEEDANKIPIAYINIEDGDWPKKFEQMESALQYKSPDVAHTNKDMANNATNYQSTYTTNNKNKTRESSSSDDDGTKCITSQNERDELGKATKAFTSAIMRMKEQISSSALFRYSFEHKHSLMWGN